MKKQAVRIIVASMVAAFAFVLGSPAQAATVWDRVAACESGGNWGASTGNGFYGGLQFTHQTWIAYGGGRYAFNANGASRAAQIAIARRVLASQGPGAWPSCGARAGLTRSIGRVGTVTVSRGVTRHALVRYSGRLVVDGVLGPRTARALQRWVGAYQDGVVGPRTISALQRKLGVRRTGHINRVTVHRLQVVLHIRRDGARYLNHRTVATLQRFLNRR